MIPYKYKKRKLKAICLRNLEKQCSYFIRISSKNNEFETFQSNNSGLTTNPTFELSDTEPYFKERMLSMESCGFILTNVVFFNLDVYKNDNPNDSIQQYEVDLRQLNRVAKTVLYFYWS